LLSDSVTFGFWTFFHFDCDFTLHSLMHNQLRHLYCRHHRAAITMIMYKWFLLPMGKCGHTIPANLKCQTITVQKMSHEKCATFYRPLCDL